MSELFNPENYRVPSTKKLTTEQRQQLKIENGQHPLSGVGSTPRHIPIGIAATSRGATCGNCFYWQPIDTHSAAGRVRKCLYAATDDGHAPRVSRSTQTDCRGKWPACTEWEPA